MTRLRVLAAIGGCVLAGVLAYTVLDRLDDNAAAPPSAAGRVPVQTAPAARRTIANIREYSGSLEASARLTVAPNVAGRVDSVAVDIGDAVAPGDLLVTLDDAEYRQARAQAEARLEVARAELAQARSDAHSASQTLERVRSLNDKGIAPAAELDDAEAAARNADAALEVARAGIAEARAQVETAGIRLGYTEIRADWPQGDAGRRVGERMVEPGDAVAANTPLLRIVAVRPLKAVIQVPEDVYTRIETGQEARLRVAGASEARHVAVIERIAPVFNPQTRRARVELRVPNDAGALAPGMFVQVGLVTERLDDTLVVPRAALVQRGGETGVFLVADDTARFVAVDVAFTQAAHAALRAPAALDGAVVTLGQAQLEDGVGVRVSEPTGTAPTR